MNEPPRNADKLFDRIRQQIVHEDSLITQRSNLLLVAQGFLFVAYATLLAQNTKFPGRTSVLFSIGLLGYLVSIPNFMSVMAAVRFQRELGKSWNEFGSCVVSLRLRSHSVFSSDTFAG